VDHPVAGGIDQPRDDCDAPRAYQPQAGALAYRMASAGPLVMHGDDDQIVPIADSAPLSAKLLKNSTRSMRSFHTACARRKLRS
jgi:hypothetical protein